MLRAFLLVPEDGVLLPDADAATVPPTNFLGDRDFPGNFQMLGYISLKGTGWDCVLLSLTGPHGSISTSNALSRVGWPGILNPETVRCPTCWPTGRRCSLCWITNFKEDPPPPSGGQTKLFSRICVVKAPFFGPYHVHNSPGFSPIPPPAPPPHTSKTVLER